MGNLYGRRGYFALAPWRFKKATSDVRQYLFVAAFSALPAESVLLEVLQDDRFLRNGSEWWREVVAEIDYLVRRPTYLWDRLARLVPCASRVLKDLVFKAAFTTAAYLQYDVFHQLRELPLSLTQGDILGSLEALSRRALDDDADPLSKQVKFLLDIGFSRERISRALTLAREAPCTTSLIEQGHAAAAFFNRYHTQLSAQSLAVRSLLHQARSLVGPSRDDKIARRIEARIDRIQSRKPLRAGGSHMFLKHLLKERRADPAWAALATSKIQLGAVRDHLRLYAEMPRVRKLAFETEARQHARVGAAANADEQALLSARLELHNLRRSQEREQVGIINHMDSFRMTDADVVNMCEMLDGTVQRHGVAALMHRQAVAPRPPSIDQQAVLLDAERQIEWPRLPCPWWCRYVCSCREHFKSAALYCAEDGVVTVAYLTLLVLQQPYVAVFLEIALQELTPACLYDSVGLPSAIMGRQNRREFSYRPLTLRLPHELPFPEDGELFVLRDMTFEGDLAVAHHAAEPFAEFVMFLGPPTRSAEARAPCRRPQVSADVRERLKAEFPFLSDEDFARLGSGGGRPGHGAGGGGGGGGGVGGGGVVGGADDMDVDDGGDSDDSSEGIPLAPVADALEALRQAWRDKDEDEMVFTIVFSADIGLRSTRALSRIVLVAFAEQAYRGNGAIGLAGPRR